MVIATAVLLVLLVIDLVVGARWHFWLRRLQAALRDRESLLDERESALAGREEHLRREWSRLRHPAMCRSLADCARICHQLEQARAEAANSPERGA